MENQYIFDIFKVSDRYVFVFYACIRNERIIDGLGLISKISKTTGLFSEICEEKSISLYINTNFWPKSSKKGVFNSQYSYGTVAS